MIYNVGARHTVMEVTLHFSEDRRTLEEVFLKFDYNSTYHNHYPLPNHNHNEWNASGHVVFIAVAIICDMIVWNST